MAVAQADRAMARARGAPNASASLSSSAASAQARRGSSRHQSPRRCRAPRDNGGAARAPFLLPPTRRQEVGKALAQLPRGHGESPADVEQHADVRVAALTLHGRHGVERRPSGGELAALQQCVGKRRSGERHPVAAVGRVQRGARVGLGVGKAAAAEGEPGSEGASHRERDE
jgi:hypothetical protein